MPRTLHYEQSVLIPARFDELFAWLGRPESHAELHPLIRELSVVDEGPGPGEGESWSEFEVLDGVKMGFVELPVRYRARMVRRPKLRRLDMEAWTKPGLHTTVRWQFTSVEGGTQLVEKVELSAPWYIVGFSARESERAHAGLLASIQRMAPTRCA